MAELAGKNPKRVSNALSLCTSLVKEFGPELAKLVLPGLSGLKEDALIMKAAVELAKECYRWLVNAFPSDVSLPT
jgi:hypothetical protein